MTVVHFAHGGPGGRSYMRQEETMPRTTEGSSWLGMSEDPAMIFHAFVFPVRKGDQNLEPHREGKRTR
jgi:hypothetical protein